LVIDSECHQVSWRVLLGELRGQDFLSVCKEIYIAKEKLLRSAFSFAMECVFPNLQEKEEGNECKFAHCF